MTSLPSLSFFIGEYAGDIESYLRWTELLVGFAFAQQSLEHLFGTRSSERGLYLARLLLAAMLALGWHPQWISLLLLFVAVLILHRFQGPYNGGSDRLSLLVIVCVCAARWLPPYGQEVALGYLGIQLILSYFMAGWVKIVNPEWRNGRALRDVFEWSAYPVSESLRKWSTWPRLLWVMSWCVMLLELLLPVAFLNRTALLLALILTATFHFTNACVFGLNRFFWIWVACYPSLLWLHARLVQ